ncbi:NACHT, LRR and PYD domains-containing protein 1 homolog [Epinephelus lanceolatus]
MPNKYTLELRYDSTDPNFYEVFVKNPDKDFKLMLTPENGHQPVWTCKIRKDDYQRSTGPLQEKHQSELLHKEVTVTPLMKKLLETLKDLSYGELEQFKHVLQRIRMKKDLPKTSSQRMEMADRDEIAELMVEIYGEQSVEVTREVLMEMNMTDLAERLLEISLGSKGPSGSSELEGCGSVTQDSSDWTKLDPEVNCTDADEAPTYSLQSGAGNFECSVSGLRWVCKEKVNFKYQFCSLSGHLERIESMEYMPAGPLMDITVIAGKLDVVYLPHWICIDDNPTILDKFAVLHIDDCGDVVEKVSEVTSSHVKLSKPVFSLKMVLVKLGLPVEIYCRVLIYSKVLTASSQTSLTLHVYLIPPDQDLIKVLDKTETSDRYKGIRKSNPAKPLKMHDWFILTTDLDGADIYPKGEEPQTLELRYDSTDPNFYEVVVKNPDKDFKLMLTPKNGHQPVWTSEILQGEWQSTGHVQAASPSAGASGAHAMAEGGCAGRHFVDEHRGQLINRVCETASVLDALLENAVIQQGTYDEILAIPTHRDRMRKLYSGPLNSAGDVGKDILLNILKETEKYLIDELMGNVSVFPQSGGGAGACRCN